MFTGTQLFTLSLALPTEDSQLTEKILEELSEMRLNRGFEMLIEYLNHHDSQVRGATAAALVNGSPGESRVADVLLKAGMRTRTLR